MVRYITIPYNTCHNHVNTETHYTALKQCKDLLSESVLSKLDAFGQTNTDTKQIASYVANPTAIRNVYRCWNTTQVFQSLRNKCVTS
ncbi:hypothetical protein GN244_ATG14788 [Phytophthora infestans]|uniref:Uncharacterized protein n=1 Tax=Phytophthora infestans TaxID=4787 RepID=A0A833SEG0_PHYIN|nr:hypothetical protein GN244_ATG14788 [Phytophthora infestans]